MFGKSTNQKDAAMFWKIASGLRQAVLSQASQEEIAEWVDEVEVMLMYTDSPVIKARCHGLLAEPREAVAAHGT